MLVELVKVVEHLSTALAEPTSRSESDATRVGRNSDVKVVLVQALLQHVLRKFAQTIRFELTRFTSKAICGWAVLQNVNSSFYCLK